MLKHIQSTDEWNEKSLGAKGFTLIELLVVIVILGILAAVVVFAVSGITDRGKESACETDLRTLRTAAEAYIAQEEPAGAVTEAQIQSAGFLSDTSEYYDVSIAGGANPTVTVTRVDSECPLP